MLKILKPFFCLGLWIAALTGCNQGAVKKEIHFEVVSDTSYVGQNNYDTNFTAWKKIYEDCMRNPLFQNAIYMGLQENVHIGSISNQYATNINKQFSLFDSSNRKNISNLFANINSVNCYTKINLSKNIQNDFNTELLKGLKNSGQYEYLTKYIDTGKTNFKITTLVDNSIRPDSLASLLQRTKDSSLLQFRQLLVTPGNALLVRTTMIFGFYCQFPLKSKLSLEDETKFSSEIFFKIGNTGDNGSIRLLSNQDLQIFINKYYTVFGQFFVFKEDK